jgi:hypothetical protein
VATQVFISYRRDGSAGSTGRVPDGLVRRADDALLLGAPVLGKYAPQSRDLRADVTPALPSHPIERPRAKSATGAVPELHCQQTLRATRAFFAMPALHCPRQPMTRDTTIASNKAGTDLREFLDVAPAAEPKTLEHPTRLVVFASQRRAVESCAVRYIHDT